MDSSQDVWLAGTGSISIPDLHNIFPLSYAYTDTDYFILCKNSNKS